MLRNERVFAGLWPKIRKQPFCNGLVVASGKAAILAKAYVRRYDKPPFAPRQDLGQIMDGVPFLVFPFIAGPTKRGRARFAPVAVAAMPPVELRHGNVGSIPARAQTVTVDPAGGLHQRLGAGHVQYGPVEVVIPPHLFHRSGNHDERHVWALFVCGFIQKGADLVVSHDMPVAFRT